MRAQILRDGRTSPVTEVTMARNDPRTDKPNPTPTTKGTGEKPTPPSAPAGSQGAHKGGTKGR